MEILFINSDHPPCFRFGYSQTISFHSQAYLYTSHLRLYTHWPAPHFSVLSLPESALFCKATLKIKCFTFFYICGLGILYIDTYILQNKHFHVYFALWSSFGHVKTIWEKSYRHNSIIRMDDLSLNIRNAFHHLVINFPHDGLAFCCSANNK